MSEYQDGDAADGVERTEQEHGAGRTEAKYRPVLRHNHERLYMSIPHKEIRLRILSNRSVCSLFPRLST